MENPMRFDDSLPALANAVAETLGEKTLVDGVVVRDVSGQLCFFAARSLTLEERATAQSRLTSVLGAYARTDRVLASPDEAGAQAILKEPGPLFCRVGHRTVRLLDRRIIGPDWVRAPSPVANGPARFVFSSLKGGVGRSTALSVVAAHLAGRGERVLAIDLDLEAPGIGAMLLSEDATPELGTLDFLIENGLAKLDNRFFADLIGPSSLVSGHGRIDVIPAFGRQSLRHPADVVGKLGRAYVEHVGEDGLAAMLIDQVRALVDHFSASGDYDAVLVDARAGLHEMAAVAMLGLGADVLLFGLDEPQTFQGYSVLLAHFTRFIPDHEIPEWVERLTPVHAKASADPSRRAAFVRQWQNLVRRHAPWAQPAGPAPELVVVPEGFTNVPWDENRSDAEVLPPDSVLQRPIAVLRDDRYEGFDPLGRRDVISAELVRATFGELLRTVELAVKPSGTES